ESAFWAPQGVLNSSTRPTDRKGRRECRGRAALKGRERVGMNRRKREPPGLLKSLPSKIGRVQVADVKTATLSPAHSLPCGSNPFHRAESPMQRAFRLEVTFLRTKVIAELRKRMPVGHLFPGASR